MSASSCLLPSFQRCKYPHYLTALSPTSEDSYSTWFNIGSYRDSAVQFTIMVQAHSATSIAVFLIFATLFRCTLVSTHDLKRQAHDPAVLTTPCLSPSTSSINWWPYPPCGPVLQVLWIRIGRL
ncbi:hypothetical protein BD410DRAFT_494616 [Rickenella mellea]|uniref:Uncharacterized protein n=1 Tax=Rickenella mellea TaxID=50990 RepID=A0A4Y7PEF3_9AGAM|nr:hypothetical protein BD410DRAFT_494616 [Rickenella mellea]